MNLSRRTWLQNSMAGACAATGALAGDAAQAEKPGDIAITKVETFVLRHKLDRAFGPSTASSPYREALLVKLSTDSGLAGWGETANLPGTRGIIEDRLKPILLGQNPLAQRKLWRLLWGPNFGDARAVAAVDLALHDARGKALGQSVADMYGGRVRDDTPAYAAAMNYVEGVRPEERFPEEAAELVERGFKAMKIRTGRLEPRRDLAILAAVRERVGDEIRLMTDGNGAFTLPAAVKFGKELEKLDFYWFEEPLPQGDNYAGYDALTAALDIALAGGEGLASRAQARDHIVKRSFDIIQPDVILCGGVAETLFIAEMARLWGMQCLPHCYAGAIAIAATLQVLSLLPTFNWGFSSDEPMLEFDTHENPFRDELIARPFAIDRGRIAVPTGPGLGIEVDEDVVKRYLVRG